MHKGSHGDESILAYLPAIKTIQSSPATVKLVLYAYVVGKHLSRLYTNMHMVLSWNVEIISNLIYVSIVGIATGIKAVWTWNICIHLCIKHPFLVEIPDCLY